MNTLQKFIFIGILGVFISNQLFADKYKLTGKDTSDGGPKSNNSVTAGCAPGTGSTYLELNNVRALIHTGGDMWWDLQGAAKYEIPKGSGKTALFAGSIWIGGTDVNGQLKIAAMKFRQTGIDYWPGPLITSGEAQASVTPDVCSAYDRHFSIEKSKVAEFRAWTKADAVTRASDFAGYQIPGEIMNWPAHGPSGGYDIYLAPFYDNNNDGSYNPYDGDYPYFDLDNNIPCGTTRELRTPRLYGDQSLWWVYNDRGNLHTETNGDAIGFEIRAQAFAFATNDELNNMTFYNYALINRSTYTLKETYFGVWTDADLGDAADDFVGCDVNRGLGYIYNGRSVDGTGQPQAYGGPNPPPPALGIDFFEGPYKDADGIDDLSSWDNNGLINCANGYRLNRTSGVKYLVGAGDILNGNINGLNFGDSVVDNERWGMRRFIYFNNDDSPLGDPKTAVQHYQYLRGYWRDGTHLVFGGTGHAESGTFTDFMFPGITDPCNWGTAGNPPPAPTNPLLGWCEKGEGNPYGDRRLVQSAGPFTLEPGAVNDITTGAVWARAASGDEYESVKLVQTADDKAQKLFENCFRVLDGPDAPELKIIEMDKKLIVHIWNKIGSNNYMEQYNQKDPFIVCPVTNTGCDKYYKFQGYQIFQLANQFVSTGELHDPAKARQVFQCDIKDGVSKLINYTWSDELVANIPVMEVSGSDEGVKHSLVISEDVFASGDKRLINNQKYYFVAIAYAYNDYLHYNQTDGSTVLGQKNPYKAGRKAQDGAIKIYEVIPHNNSSENNGTIITSDYGDGVSITQVEGHGNGSNELELSDETFAEIMSGAPWKSLHQTYKIDKGPIKVKIIDPLNIPGDQYTLKLDTHSLSKIDPSNSPTIEWFNTVGSASYGLIKNSKWFIYNSKFDTINSDQWIVSNDERIIPEWGISVNIQQVAFPLVKPKLIKGHYPNAGYIQQKDSLLGPLVNNGVIESTIENSDNTKQWLYFLSDQDGQNELNWIRSGSYKDGALTGADPTWDDYFYSIPDPVDTTESIQVPWDQGQAYEKIIGGGWAPYFLCQKTLNSAGPAWDRTFDNFHLKINDGVLETGLNSVEIVITPDKSKWSRCPVIELCNDTNLAVGRAPRFTLRRSYSIDKNGNASTVNVASENPNDANYIGANGMGWFPGYAIDTETGERLNIIYGEDSWYPGDNGADMIWNPSNNVWSFLGEPIFGGKHYIYVMGNPVNYKPKISEAGVPTVNREITLPDPNDATKKWYLKNYDEGRFFYAYYSKYPKALLPNNPLNQMKSGPHKILSTTMWVSIPMSSGLPLENKTVPLSEIKVKIKLAKPYTKGYKAYALDSTLSKNNNFPMYTFNTSLNKSITGDIETAKNALDLIGVVPNPYYGYNAYEATQTDNLVKIINLPKRCTVTIFTVSGTLVRKFNKDSESTIIEWDLKNNYGISISSGLYIIHINTPGIGEKIVKWFGAMRPIDLNAF